MDEERIDLSPLDPARDPQRWQAFVERTLGRAEAALERRGRAGAWGVLAAWGRPVLAAAAVLAAVLVAATALIRGGAKDAGASGAAHVLAVHSSEWATGARPFSTRELIASLEADGRP
jgi:hypothetical protein